jgi:hypothetical protein
MKFRQTPDGAMERRWKARRASLEDRLVRHPLGRSLLHTLAWCRTRRNFAWHWDGIRRDFREAFRWLRL